MLNEVVVNPDAQFLKIGKVQQFRGGKLVTVTEKRAAVVRAGQRLKLRVNLVGGTRARWQNFEFTIPRRARGWDGAFFVSGGAEGEEEEDYRTGRTGRTASRAAADRSELEQLFAQLRRRPRADQVRGAFFLEGRDYIERSQLKAPLGIPVTGFRFCSLVVR